MQDFKGFRIGEVSQLLGISVQAIRHYQKLGLVVPSFVDESGYRYFNNEGLGKLYRITVLKSAGFSLQNIKQMERLNISENKEVYIDQKNKLIKSIKKQQAALNYIERRVNSIKLLEDFKSIKGEYKYFPESWFWGRC